jgi:peptidoglycan/xylan/chitin deacetylase (PgdA/CDA1 family)
MKGTRDRDTASVWAPVMRRLLEATSRHKLTILIYHRVHAVTDPIFPGVADAARFDRQMSWIRSTFNIVPLPDGIGMLRARRLPPRAGCITFDDGYADNAEIAMPILQRHRLHATFFIATAFLDGGRMWNDTIIEAVRRVSGSVLDLRALGLGCLPVDSAASRRAAIDMLLAQTKYLARDARKERVAAIARSAKADLPRDLMMRSDQVRSLHRAGMEIGAHTVTHPILARLDSKDARAEISAGRATLESLLGSKVTLFAYPNGKPGVDYAPEHVAMVRELGFDAAFSTRPAAADATSDPYELPRFTPWGRTYLRLGTDLLRRHAAGRRTQHAIR